MPNCPRCQIVPQSVSHLLISDRVSDHFDAQAWYRFRTCQIHRIGFTVFNFRVFFSDRNCGNRRFRAKYAEMAGRWRDWGRLRLTKNGGGRNNSICGNLPLGLAFVHPPSIWVVRVPPHRDDQMTRVFPGELIVLSSETYLLYLRLRRLRRSNNRKRDVSSVSDRQIGHEAPCGN